MKLMKTLLIFCLLAISCGAPAYGAPQGAINPRTITFPPLKFQIPKSDRVTLKNGMVVYLLQDHDLPLVNVTAYINAGSIFDPAEKSGLASITASAMRSGGSKRTPPEKLDAELEFMASAIEAAAGMEYASISMTTLTSNLDRTLQLMTELLLQPGFDQTRLEVLRKQAIEAVRRENDDPKAVADRELRRAIYPNSPLGRTPTVPDLQRITREDVIAFKERYVIPANTILAISGDFDKNEILECLNRMLAQWPQRTPSFPQIAAPKESPMPEVLHVQKGVNQSVIRMGHLGIEKNNPDLYALKVLDYILGGGFTSRLTQEIRSNQGLAYNVESDFEVGRRFPGTFITETETKSGTTGRAITLMHSIVEGMTKAEVTDRELNLAKDAIVNSFIFGFTKTEAVVNQQARLEFFSYPPNYLETYREKIAKVTKEDVLRVARKYLHPEAMKLVVVGDEKKFDQPLSTFGSVQEIKLQNSQ
ncbi:insulinase family protein [Geomonas sp. RF6]|uniref:M16 family metallopeptidase n=1 Tax=Geomonas sp. RF6 TaxID=2897342 RepID=UPI001E2A9079|nr:pitrilysin family protein [Geomonas sp. RF6]UFS71517.1 insulinase family protein [Geomonas sp. RF6]